MYVIYNNKVQLGYFRRKGICIFSELNKNFRSPFHIKNTRRLSCFQSMTQRDISKSMLSVKEFFKLIVVLERKK